LHPQPVANPRDPELNWREDAARDPEPPSETLDGGGPLEVAATDAGGPGSDLKRLIARAEELRQEMDAALQQRGQHRLGRRVADAKGGPEGVGSPGSRSGEESTPHIRVHAQRERSDLSGFHTTGVTFIRPGSNLTLLKRKKY
jgi:hypothetical protein